MEIKTTYIAFDDTEFDTEEECLEYESNANPEGAVRFFNAQGEELFDKEPCELFEASYYIYIVDEEKATAFLDWLMYYSGYTIPGEIKTGCIYVYDEDEGDYYDLTERVDDLTKKLNTISSAISSTISKQKELNVYTKVTEGMPTEFGYGPEWVSTAMFMDDYPKFYTQEEAIGYWNNVLSKEDVHD